MDDNGSPEELVFVFSCNLHSHNHPNQFRARSKTGSGTSNLASTSKACLASQGVIPSNTSSTKSSIPYSLANHRALIAMRCAKNARPFNSVYDEDYLNEVEMLRPGTIVPSPSTVSRDINDIYVALSTHVKNYFFVCSLFHFYCE